MEASALKILETRVKQEVLSMLTEGDWSYLNGLSHSAMIEALEGELGFLGLYSHKDTETPRFIKELLGRHLTKWLLEPEVQFWLKSPSPGLVEFSTENHDFWEGEPNQFYNFEPIVTWISGGDVYRSPEDERTQNRNFT